MSNQCISYVNVKSGYVGVMSGCSFFLASVSVLRMFDALLKHEVLRIPLPSLVHSGYF